VGFLSDMFGGQSQHYERYVNQMRGVLAPLGQFASDIRGEYTGLGRQLQDEYGDLAQDAFSSIMGIYGDLEEERGDFLATLDERFGQNIASMESDLARGRETLEDYFGRAYDELATGRDASLELLAQQSATATARASQAAAFGGMAGTSFGQQTVAATERQGALEQAALREQYGAQLAGQLNLAGQTLGQYDQNTAAALGQLRTAQTGAYLQGFQDYSGRLQNLRQSAEGARLDLIGQGLGAYGSLATTGLGSYEQQYGDYLRRMIDVESVGAEGRLQTGLGRYNLGQQIIGQGIGFGLKAFGLG